MCALIDQADLPTPDGPAVVLVVCGEKPYPAVLVGPFPIGTEAERWATALQAVTGNHPASCRVVPLNRTVE